MIQLTQRQQTILIFLITAESAIPVRTVAEKFHLSARTIRYDLEQIEAYLAGEGGRLIKRSGWGVLLELSEQKRRELLSDAETPDTAVRVLSRDERSARLIRSLLLSPKPVTADTLALDLQVSRTTVLGDLRGLDKRLAVNKLTLYSKKGEGFWVGGNETDVRRSIVEAITDILPSRYSASPRTLSEAQLRTHLDEGGDLAAAACYLCEAQLDRLIELTHAAQDLIPYSMQGSDHLRLLIYLAVAVTRLRGGHPAQPPAHRRIGDDSREIQLGQLLAGRLGMSMGLTLDREEAYRISVWLIACNIKFPPKANDKILAQLSQTVDTMLEVLAEHPSYQLPAFYLDKLKMNLISHLKLSIKKHHMQIASPNPLLIQMKVNYPEIFTVVYRMAEKFEERTEVPLGEDEIGFIAIHIAACVEECSKLKTKKALIVCNTGRGAAMVLQNRISTNIPRLELQGTVSALDVVESSQLRSIDLIISTIELPDIGKPVFRVSPIITQGEMNRINSYLNGSITEDRVEKLHSSRRYLMSMVLQQTDKYVTQEDRKKLESDLQGIMDLAEAATPVQPVGGGYAEAAALRTAMVVARLGGIAGELSALYGIDFSYDKVFGLAIHLLMSIPRWEKGFFTRESAPEEFIAKHPDIYAYIVKVLRESAEECGIAIPDREAVAIMRYLV